MLVALNRHKLSRITVLLLTLTLGSGLLLSQPAKAQYGMQQAAAGLVRAVNRAQRQNAQSNRQKNAFKQQQKIQKQQAKQQEKQMKLQAKLQEKQMKLQAKLQAQQAKLQAKGQAPLQQSAAPNQQAQNFGQSYLQGPAQNYGEGNFNGGQNYGGQPNYNQGAGGQGYYGAPQQ
jgi:Skp family chaperone for outer membrane proteins